MYQLLYFTASKGQKENRYDHYDFSVIDAMHWLLQTGPNMNFVLQIRDTEKAGDQVKVAVEMQWNIIKQFLHAKLLLDEHGCPMELPNFFVGTPEANIDVNKYGIDGVKKIYDGINELVRNTTAALFRKKIGVYKSQKNIIKGLYFGSEGAASSSALMRDVQKYMVGKGELLWIPYFFWDDELEHIVKKSEYFTTVILQPSTFYRNYKSPEHYEDVRKKEVKGICRRYIKEEEEKWEAIFAIITAEGNEKYGVEIEFDLGYLTGRSDYPPGGDAKIPMDASAKQKAFDEYIYKIVPKIGISPIGIYSGGPNEQGYNNIFTNTNTHSNDNHEAMAKGFGTGSRYSELYDRENIIYRMSRVLFSDYSIDAKINLLEKLFKKASSQTLTSGR
jgi:hypothetical protein